MKKILIFSTAYLPFTGGAEVAIKEITDRLGDIEFDLITAKIDKSFPKTEKIGKIQVYRVGFGSKLDKFLLPFLGLRLALRLHKDNKYFLAWAMMASQASVAAVWFKALTKIKLLTTLQEGDEEDHLRRYVFGNDFLYKLLIKPWHTLAIRKADRIQMISKYLKKRAREAGAVCEISIIPNGVDIQTFTEEFSAAEQSHLREKLGFKKDDKILISVSRLVKKNGIDILIKALSLIKDSNIKLLILGWQQRNKEEEEHGKLVNKLGLKNRVNIINFKPNKEIPEYLSIADIFVRPSRSEGQGIAFLEAMAAGVPVVACPVGGILDFLTDKQTGIFCKVDDPDDLAQKIKLLLDNEHIRQGVVINARSLVKKKYNWVNLAQDMNKIFIGLMNN